MTEERYIKGFTVGKKEKMSCGKIKTVGDRKSSRNDTRGS